MAEEKENKNQGDEREEEAESRVYELGYLLVPTFSEEELGGAVAALKSELQEHGGSFITEEFPRKITLAYPMTHETGAKRIVFTSAYFGWIKYGARPGEAPALSKVLRQNPSLIRFLSIKTVRESTMAPKRPAFVAKPEVVPPTMPARREEKILLTEEELDRTIEKLVIE